MQWTSCPQQQTQEKRVKIKKGTLRRLRGGGIRFESGREASIEVKEKIIWCYRIFGSTNMIVITVINVCILREDLTG